MPDDDLLCPNCNSDQHLVCNREGDVIHITCTQRDIADQLADLFARALRESSTERREDLIDSNTVAMLDAESIGRSPGWRHLGRLLEERGWKGWTDVEPPERLPMKDEPA